MDNKYTIKLIDDSMRIGETTKKELIANVNLGRALDEVVPLIAFEDALRWNQNIIFDEDQNIYVKVSHRDLEDDEDEYEYGTTYKAFNSVLVNHSHDSFYELKYLMKFFKEIMKECGKDTYIEWWDRNEKKPKDFYKTANRYMLLEIIGLIAKLNMKNDNKYVKAHHNAKELYKSYFLNDLVKLEEEK